MIVIDLQSSVTLEEQICSAIRQLIALGKLQEGDPLPSVRQLGRPVGALEYGCARLLGLSTANTRSFVINELKRWSSKEKRS
jgi:hypothetical protein